MNSWHPFTKTIIAIGGIAIVALVLTSEGERQTQAIASTPSVERSAVADKVEALQIRKLAMPVPSTETIQEMVDRPLFSSSRRPPQVEAEPEAVFEPAVAIEKPITQSEPEMSFIGSVVRNDIVSALIKSGYGGPVEEIAVGEEVDGWKVLEIGNSSISLGLDDRRLEYKIFEGSAN